MKKSLTGWLLVLGLFSAMAFAGQTSGYLGDDTYAKLKEKTSASGNKVKRWIAPALSSGKYTAVMLEKSILYPEPKPTEQVSAEVMQQITAYLDEAIRRELNGVIELATQPGANTMIFKPAITAASAQIDGFPPFERIPVGFVSTRGSLRYTAGNKTTGVQAKEAALALEWQVLDAETNELVGAGVRSGAGQRLKSPDAQVTLEDFKPMLDAWAKDARGFIKSTKDARAFIKSVQDKDKNKQ